MQASMKVAVGLCLLAAMCTSRSLDDKDDFIAERLQIRNARSKVESITRRLNHIKKDVEEDTIERVTKRMWDEMDNFSDYIYLLRDAMRREVNAAKDKGIDAEHCYDTNSKGIDGVRVRAANNSQKCIETATNNIRIGLTPLDSIKLTGDLLVDELDSLFTYCHDISTSEMQACLHRELAEIEIKINSYDHDVNSAELSAVITSNNVAQQANKCLNNIYVLARVDSEDSMVSNAKCVKEALEKKIQAKRFIRAIRYGLI